MSDIDLFDDLATDTEQNVSPDQEQPTDTTTPETESQSDVPEAPVETVTEIPADAISVTQFAAHMTQHLMKAKLEAGDDLTGTEYVVPQEVYQTVRAKKDRIPHVLVQGPDDKEARVYILKTPATEWWTERQKRLVERGSGTAAASSRTPEQNLTLLHAAVQKLLWATDREKMWADRKAQSEKLVAKYQGFLADADVSEDTVKLAIQEATDAYAAEQAAKAKEKSSKKSDSEPETAPANA